MSDTTTGAVDPNHMHTDARTAGVKPMHMHTDAQVQGTQPAHMHTDAGSGGTVTPFHMHTDLRVGGETNGISLSAKNSSGGAVAVTISSGIATELGQAIGLGAAPAAEGPSQVTPFHMHTDGQTTVVMNEAGSAVTITGPADGPQGLANLKVTIDGPALAALKGSHAGI